MMRIVKKIKTAPSVSPVTLATAKAHMRVDFDNDDTIIQVYIDAATALCEQILQRKLITQTWNFYLSYWPEYIKVLFGDLQSVTSIKYTDVDEDELTFDSANYDVDIIGVPGRIYLKNDKTWPTVTLNAVNPINIEFKTGYGDAPANVPDDIKNAILLTTAHFYENRENYLVADMKAVSIAEIPWTANTLLYNHRIWDWIL